MSNDASPASHEVAQALGQGVYTNQRDFSPIVAAVYTHLECRSKKGLNLPIRIDGAYGERLERGIVYLTYSPYTPEGGKAPTADQLTHFTPAAVKLLARQLLRGAHDGDSAAKELIPAHVAHPQADGTFVRVKNTDTIVDYLASIRELKAGKNKGKFVNTVAQALKSRRNAYERETREQDLAETKANGDAWYARDANGNLRAFPSQAKALKFAARTLFGADWWQEHKEKRLEVAKGHVHQQADAVGEVGHRDEQKYAMALITDASHQQIRKAVQALGCPRPVYTGKGAKARMIEWIAEDIARVESVSKAVTGA